jgi:5-methyltetrahydropteroyltriglutamate--homocysteine methyltransferase
VPVLIGPVSFLLLAKPGDGVDEDFDHLSLIEPLLGVYGEVIERLAEHGAEWVQLDEPCFVMSRDERELDALRLAYEELSKVHERTRLLVKTYFDHVGDAYAVLRETPIDGIGLDFSGAPERAEPGPDFVLGRENVGIARDIGRLEGKTLFAGIVDGRNVWINDLHASLEELREFADIADEVVVSTSCSLLHTPVDLDAESDLDDELRSWMAFAKQKVAEVAILAKGLAEGNAAIETELAANVEALQSRRESKRSRNPAVRERVESLGPQDAERASGFEARREAQRAELELPQFPTTTIGSYPQTTEIRTARAELREGKIDGGEYEQRMRAEIERVIRFQEEVGLDVLVHGEPERNDMVQYFAEQMEGYAFTQNAWVQSYGSRCVRPPILFGDVSRPNPMTLEWINYAQSLTERPVKGMLTGPVTMLQWSFVRDDQPLEETCEQLALAIRDEVGDLEEAGVRVIQVDEPAIREGLPLRRERWNEYLEWAVRCFRIATSGVDDAVQIQTHMCYSDFGDIMGQIQAMDADVLLIEAARSRMGLLHEWERTGYQQDIGPGVYDIHSPRVPPTDEMAKLLEAAAKVLRPEQLWVNPDCGLKTRAWPETEAALRNMVDAARQAREQLVPAG